MQFKLVVLVLALASMSFATSVSLQQTQTVTFNNIDAFIMTPGSFTALGLSTFDKASWLGSDVNVSAHETTAGGNLISELTYNLNFDYTSTPVTVDEFFLNGTTLRAGVRYVYNGQTLTQTGTLTADQLSLDRAVGVSTSTPDSPTFNYAFLGIAAFVINSWQRRRKRRNNLLV